MLFGTPSSPSKRDAGEREREREIYIYIYVYIYIYIYIGFRDRIPIMENQIEKAMEIEWTRVYIRFKVDVGPICMFICKHIYIYIYIYLCPCPCVLSEVFFFFCGGVYRWN